MSGQRFYVGDWVTCVKGVGLLLDEGKHYEVCGVGADGYVNLVGVPGSSFKPTRFVLRRSPSPGRIAAMRAQEVINTHPEALSLTFEHAKETVERLYLKADDGISRATLKTVLREAFGVEPRVQTVFAPVALGEGGRDSS